LSFVGRNQPRAASAANGHDEILLRLDEIKRMLAARS
jgi:hypothetical protein